MGTLPRYLIRQLLGRFALYFCGLVALFILIKSSDLITLMVDGGFSPELYGFIVLFEIPLLTERLLPVSLFAATLATCLHLGSTGELKAMQGFGLSSWSLIKPILTTATFLCIANLLIAFYVAPYTYRKADLMIFEARTDAMLTRLQPKHVQTLGRDFTLFFDAIENRDTLHNLVVETNTSALFLATRAQLTAGPDYFLLHMENGNWIQRTPAHSVIAFDTYTLTIPFAELLPARWLSLLHLYIHELIRPPVHTRGAHLDAPETLRREFHFRVSRPMKTITTILLTLLIAFSVRPPLLAAAGAIACFVTLEILSSVLINISPNIPISALGVHLLYLVPLLWGIFTALRRP